MSLSDWLSGRTVPAPPQLKITERGPLADTSEEQQDPLSPPDRDGDGIPDAIEGIALGMEYADAAGEISARRLIAERVTPASGGFLYLEGWCLLRNDRRRFRSDRMLKLMIPPTWDPIADPTGFLREFALEPRPAQRRSRTINPKVVCRDGLAVLLYVARSDSEVPPAAEREAINLYIAAACRRAGIPADDTTVAKIAAYADTLYPSARSMGRYLGRLERDPGALDILVPCLDSLVRADGVYSAHEQQAVATLLKAIGRARQRIAKEGGDQPTTTIHRGDHQAAALTRPRQVPGNFVALDVETANADMASICSIGLVHFKAGEVAQKLTVLVNPECHFDPMNISIHGIRPDDVANAKTMREVLPAIASALKSVVVVHHTHFDRAALSQAAAKHGFPDLACRWLDSARVARRAWERFARRGYGLANLAEEFAINFRHHDACEDARAAGLVLLRAMAETGLSLDDWMERINEPVGSKSVQAVAASNPRGPLAGEIVVFTGQLATLTRREAVALATAAGMEVAGSVTEDTSLLVVDDQDLRKLDGHDKSTKRHRAEELISQGAPLRIIGESDFKTMVIADHGAVG